MRKLSFAVGTMCIFILVCGTANAVERGIGEFSGFAGMASASNRYTGNHFGLGGTFGANAGRIVHLFGEFNYMPMGTVTGSSYKIESKIMNYGGGLNFRIPVNDKIEPYALISFGLGQLRDKYASGTFSETEKENTGYLGLGGGARIFIGKKWGVRPEIRYQSYLGNLDDPNAEFSDRGRVLSITGGIFFQFGGGD